MLRLYIGYRLQGFMHALPDVLGLKINSYHIVL